MKKLTAATVTLLFLTAAPAFAMSCCGSGKGKGAMMCGKGGMAMNHAGMKGKKASCERMSGNMSKRS